MAPRDKAVRRTLGSTGLSISALGLGGFHQVETSQRTVDAVVSRFLEWGGNYIETARGYGDGASEIKLGKALQRVSRDRTILASKSSARTRDEAAADIEASLRNLRTDRIDVYFFHNIGTRQDLERTIGPGGALEAFTAAQQAGQVRWFGLSSHWPEMYLECLDRLPFDVVLIWGNYLDFCNFPEIPGAVLPALQEAGKGILFMKPLADGFLYRSPGLAFPYALAAGAHCLVSGFNSVDMLETDIEACAQGPADHETIARILATAPELGTYVCRQCPDCSVFPEPASLSLKRLFELEGKVDRQMDSRLPADAGQYALRERLKGWFGTAGRARELYATADIDLGELLSRQRAPCHYGLDVPRKARIAHAKLADPGSVPLL